MSNVKEELEAAILSSINGNPSGRDVEFLNSLINDPNLLQISIFLLNIGDLPSSSSTATPTSPSSSTVDKSCYVETCRCIATSLLQKSTRLNWRRWNYEAKQKIINLIIRLLPPSFSVVSYATLCSAGGTYLEGGGIDVPEMSSELAAALPKLHQLNTPALNALAALMSHMLLWQEPHPLEHPLLLHLLQAANVYHTNIEDSEEHRRSAASCAFVGLRIVQTIAQELDDDFQTQLSMVRRREAKLALKEKFRFILDSISSFLTSPLKRSTSYQQSPDLVKVSMETLRELTSILDAMTCLRFKVDEFLLSILSHKEFNEGHREALAALHNISCRFRCIDSKGEEVNEEADRSDFTRFTQSCLMLVKLCDTSGSTGCDTEMLDLHKLVASIICQYVDNAGHRMLLHCSTEILSIFWRNCILALMVHPSLCIARMIISTGCSLIKAIPVNEFPPSWMRLEDYLALVFVRTFRIGDPERIEWMHKNSLANFNTIINTVTSNLFESQVCHPEINWGVFVSEFVEVESDLNASENCEFVELYSRMKVCIIQSISAIMSSLSAKQIEMAVTYLQALFTTVLQQSAHFFNEEAIYAAFNGRNAWKHLDVKKFVWEIPAFIVVDAICVMIEAIVCSERLGEIIEESRTPHGTANTPIDGCLKDKEDSSVTVEVLSGLVASILNIEVNDTFGVFKICLENRKLRFIIGVSKLYCLDCTNLEQVLSRLFDVILDTSMVDGDKGGHTEYGITNDNAMLSNTFIMKLILSSKSTASDAFYGLCKNAPTRLRVFINPILLQINNKLKNVERNSSNHHLLIETIMSAASASQNYYLQKQVIDEIFTTSMRSMLDETFTTAISDPVGLLCYLFMESTNVNESTILRGRRWNLLNILNLIESGVKFSIPDDLYAAMDGGFYSKSQHTNNTSSTLQFMHPIEGIFEDLLNLVILMTETFQSIWSQKIPDSLFPLSKYEHRSEGDWTLGSTAVVLHTQSTSNDDMNTSILDVEKSGVTAFRVFFYKGFTSLYRTLCSLYCTANSIWSDIPSHHRSSLYKIVEAAIISLPCSLLECQIKYLWLPLMRDKRISMTNTQKENTAELLHAFIVTVSAQLPHRVANEWVEVFNDRSEALSKESTDGGDDDQSMSCYYGKVSALSQLCNSASQFYLSFFEHKVMQTPQHKSIQHLRNEEEEEVDATADKRLERQLMLEYLTREINTNHEEYTKPLHKRAPLTSLILNILFQICHWPVMNAISTSIKAIKLHLKSIGKSLPDVQASTEATCFEILKGFWNVALLDRSFDPLDTSVVTSFDGPHKSKVMSTPLKSYFDLNAQMSYETFVHAIAGAIYDAIKVLLECCCHHLKVQKIDMLQLQHIESYKYTREMLIMIKGLYVQLDADEFEEFARSLIERNSALSKSYLRYMLVNNMGFLRGETDVAAKHPKFDAQMQKLRSQTVKDIHEGDAICYISRLFEE